jgi:hypothetical protein
MRGEADADELIAAAVSLLESGVAPGLTGDVRFKTLMAIAALRMAERERALAGRLDEARSDIYLASSTRSFEEVRKRVRSGRVPLGAWLHRALLRDAILRTAVTKPGALTDVERKMVELD